LASYSAQSRTYSCASLHCARYRATFAGETPPGELHLVPCKIGFAAFYESLGRVDLTESHPDEKPFAISGTKVREQLTTGQRPDPRIMRPEIADILIEAYRG